MSYEFTPEMDEISGFGGTYESGCRIMVKAGLDWFDLNPTADPQVRGYKNIYGIISEENDSAKALVRVMVDAVNLIYPDGGVTGAMIQATVSHVLWIRKHSWQEYVDVMSKRDKSKDGEP